MPLDVIHFNPDGIVGRLAEPVTYSVTWRHTTNFAAALDDTNPAYLDDTRREGIIAPPTFPVAVTWPMVEALPLQLADSVPPEALFRLMHASEWIEIHKPIVPGMTLKIKAEVASVIPTPVGTEVRMMITARDGKETPVFTEYMGGMLRSVDCGQDKPLGNPVPVMPEVTPFDKTPWAVSLMVNRRDPYVYDACSNIVFPIHTSPQFAKNVGLPDIVLQGTATLGMAVREIVNREADGDPTRVQAITGNFRAMVKADETIVIQPVGEAKEGDSRWVMFEVLNKDGKPAIQGGGVKLS